LDWSRSWRLPHLAQQQRGWLVSPSLIAPVPGRAAHLLSFRTPSWVCVLELSDCALGGQEVLGGGECFPTVFPMEPSATTIMGRQYALAYILAVSTTIDMPSRAPVASATVGTGSITGFDVVIGDVHLIHRPQQPSRKSRQSHLLPGP
jgi:hypothetical protein